MLCLVFAGQYSRAVYLSHTSCRSVLGQYGRVHDEGCTFHTRTGKQNIYVHIKIAYIIKMFYRIGVRLQHVVQPGLGHFAPLHNILHLLVSHTVFFQKRSILITDLFFCNVPSLLRSLCNIGLYICLFLTFLYEMHHCAGGVTSVGCTLEMQNKNCHLHNKQPKNKKEE